MSLSRRRVIPDATIARLPIYQRCLAEMEQDGTKNASSEQLAELAGVNAAKVRKDLSYFGTYGIRGVGYDVVRLQDEIRRELGMNHEWPCVIVGAGNLGSALAKFGGFVERGFSVVAIMDVDESKVGTPVGDLVVRHEDELPVVVRDLDITIGIITTTAGSAQDVADQLVDAGIRSILNFAPAVLDVPMDVLVRDVDVAVELQILAFHEERRSAAGTELVN